MGYLSACVHQVSVPRFIVLFHLSCLWLAATLLHIHGCTLFSFYFDMPLETWNEEKLFA